MGMVDFANVLTGFSDRSRDIRADESRRADRQWELERRTLEYLATSDDPDIRAAAITGILDTSSPQSKRGLGGWFGQVQAHPAFGTIRQLLDTPVTDTKQVPTPESGKPIYGPEAGLGQGFVQGERAGVPDAEWEPGGMMDQVMKNSPIGKVTQVIQGAGNAIAAARGRAPIDFAPVTTTHRREAFGSPSDMEAKRTEALYRGRMQGLIGTANQYGVQFSPDDIQDMMRGMAGAPRRYSRMKPKFVQFRDGSTGMVSYNEETGEATDENGNDVRGEIVKELPRSGSGAGKPITKMEPVLDASGNPTGAYRNVVYEPQPDGSYKKVELGPGVGPSQAVVPGMMPGSTNPEYVQVPRQPGAKPTGTGVAPRPQTSTTNDPKIAQAKTRLASITHDLDAIDKESKIGGMISKARADKAAQRRGYTSYDAARKQLEAARQEAGGGGVEPPPGPASEGTGFGTAGGADQIRKYLPNP